MNDSISTPTIPAARETLAEDRSWKEAIARFQKPALARSLWQIVNTLVPYATLWYLMYRSLAVSYWLTAALALVATGFLVRTLHGDRKLPLKASNPPLLGRRVQR